ncbi:Major facilitator superfamily domain general substrate transporter [Penicillium cf. griseofulvum]|uniref:Major facilitator superfamily domain general substrate transporter n=1 Tax=Penicillium cf. griseofulvum TaxID=2972120 RepID=A0A9W9MFF9_9EURO|nr:Major facilitator superfamily domain general substrate transporter [Penicillium cf. griseofulvum]KAJ5423845.1 Major facilitator superfamily domain general substrate transporter [Penicillium cf. griseofulvum]KAJ5430901.1 Major facilitator superfamily domain general substrate transporter [Penicillium cf. griseofulvum]
MTFEPHAGDHRPNGPEDLDLTPPEGHGGSAPVSNRSSMSYTRTYSTPATGAQTPDPLMGNKIVDKVALQDLSINDIGREINESYVLDTTSKMKNRKHADSVSHPHPDSDEESGSPTRIKQGIPPELSSFTAELILIFVCSAGLMLFSFLLGDMLAPQEQIKTALGITNTELPWVVQSAHSPSTHPATSCSSSCAPCKVSPLASSSQEA